MSRYLPDFAGIFCLAIFIVSITTIDDSLIKDGDSLWHIKAGTVMLEQQDLIDRDIFSHTASGVPWTAHEWLSEIIMAGVHTFAGLEGLFCFFVLVASLSFWLLYKLTEKNASQLVTLGCISLALAFSQSHMAARPHMFTWLFMLVTLSILSVGGKRLYWLPVIMVVWANLHGGFIIGLVLQAIFILGVGIENYAAGTGFCREAIRPLRTPALVLFLSVIAVGVNPFGYELLLFPFRVSNGIFQEMIGEWQSPNLQSMWYFRYYLIALSLLFFLPRSAATWTERLLFIFFLNAALTHLRHVSLMLMVLTPCLAKMFNNHINHWRHKNIIYNDKAQIQTSATTGPLTTFVIALSLIIYSSVNHQTLTILSPKKMFNVKTEQLTQLSSYLEKNLPAGKMFNEYSLGGYLLYALTTPPKVFIDGRADMYGEQILSDYNTINSSATKRETLLGQYDIDWIVFEKGSELIADLKRSKHWQTTYENEHYAVITRTDTGHLFQEP